MSFALPHDDSGPRNEPANAVADGHSRPLGRRAGDCRPVRRDARAAPPITVGVDERDRDPDVAPALDALVALIRFYGSVTDAIDLWVDPKYRPLVHAAFTLTLLLTSLIGVSVLVRELSDRY
ncbi:gamma-glutamylcyclotransferase [Natrinema mahii]|nr:gamma-glutamylcyclotransferase [Natrinema mahii]